MYIFQDATGGLSNAKVEVKNGFIFCSFTRQAVTEIAAPTHTVTIDLVSSVITKMNFDKKVRGV